MAKSDSYQQLTVRLANHDYPIYIGNNILIDCELLCRHIRASQVLIVTNDTVAPLYLKLIQSALSSFQVDVVVLPDGEVHKNQQCLFAIYDALVKLHHHRDTTLIALGGGVVGDMTGFAAATYHRGVHFIQIPTTLLAQVDASIGGKTAINHPEGKNLIGSFHQPHAVIIDLKTLTTLPLREFRAGFAEVIKYALLAGGAFFKMLNKALAEGLSQTSTKQLADLITQCCRIKAEFVQEDPLEAGRRVLLNLGHTFAHALEAYTDYQRWLHGEAVAIGLYCAALLSHQLGHLDQSSLNLVDSLLVAAKLPHRIPRDIVLDDILVLMFNDKKVKNNTLRFVLMRGIGDCYLDNQVSEESLRRALLMAVEV